mmetsp:Transcript_25170/g.72168  ORF Transcript_25170/g.72168 Transcript_25170/m.72168 type:complete len:237 (-) Transcript_25170:222-932(-)
MGTAERRGTFRLVFFPDALNFLTANLTCDCQKLKSSCAETAHPHRSQALQAAMRSFCREALSPELSLLIIFQLVPASSSPPPSGRTFNGSRQVTVPGLQTSEPSAPTSTRSPTASCSGGCMPASCSSSSSSGSADLQYTKAFAASLQLLQSRHALQRPRGRQKPSELRRTSSAEPEACGCCRSGTAGATQVLRRSSSRPSWPRRQSMVSALKALKPALRSRSLSSSPRASASSKLR